jgi:hypothetical protein
MPAANVAQQLQQAAAQAPRRQVYEYPIPVELSWDGKEHSVGLVELTSDEELMAAKRAQNEAMRLAKELAKASVYEIDGKRLSVVDGSADEAWGRFGAPLRNLLVEAYADIHVASDKAKAHFLGGRKVKVA